MKKVVFFISDCKYWCLPIFPDQTYEGITAVKEGVIQINNLILNFNIQSFNLKNLIFSWKNSHFTISALRDFICCWWLL